MFSSVLISNLKFHISEKSDGFIAAFSVRRIAYRKAMDSALRACGNDKYGRMRDMLQLDGS